MASWTTTRKAGKRHRCGSCENRIAAGEAYLSHVCTPDHDGMGNTNWWRMAECGDCAKRYGRPIGVQL